MKKMNKMNKMKVLMFVLTLLVVRLVYAQTPVNYVVNGGFEFGNIVYGEDQLFQATGWDKRPTECGFYAASPDLFDTRSSVCEVEIPTNKWAINTSERTNGYRYVGLSAQFINGGGSLVGEDIRGSLTQLPSSCGDYNLSFYVHTIDGYSQPNTSPCYPINSNITQSSKIEVYLSKSGSCSRKLIYSSSTIYGNSDWQLISTTFTLSASDLMVGYDKIDINTKKFINEYGQSVGGILLIDDVVITTGNQITPSINGTLNYCENDPLIFNGVISGTTDSYLWEIVESDESGNQTGSFTWDTGWITGTPIGDFTFPSGLNIECGKYYRVKLVGSNGCNPWSETTKVIFISCNPEITELEDVILCAGDGFPVSLNAGASKGHTFSWTYNGNPISGTTYVGTFNGPNATVNVEGEFCAIKTKTSTGCESEEVCVTVEYDPRVNNTPEFFNQVVSCTNGHITVDIQVASLNGYSNNNMVAKYRLWKDDGTGSFYYTGVYYWDNNNINPYLTFGGPNNLLGFDMDEGESYKIERVIRTWPEEDECLPWQYFMGDEINCTSKPGGKSRDYKKINKDVTIDVVKDIYIILQPNPTTGNFTLSLENAVGNELVQVIDYTGKVVCHENMNSNKITIDMNHLSNGIYFVKVISGNSVKVEKLIKQ
ncbi:MAG: T9SS type A sorting domain-containing protein [Flavobacteriales bacterium]|nr:T9SS type A sorting domain-containing protein [Flavobacteriales bacterium]